MKSTSLHKVWPDHMRRWLGILALPVCIGACSTQAWYEGVREGGRQQCRHNPDSGSARDCLDKLERKSADEYEQYDKARRAPASTPQ